MLHEKILVGCAYSTQAYVSHSMDSEVSKKGAKRKIGREVDGAATGMCRNERLDDRGVKYTRRSCAYNCSDQAKYKCVQGGTIDEGGNEQGDKRRISRVKRIFVGGQSLVRWLFRRDSWKRE